MNTMPKKTRQIMTQKARKKAGVMPNLLALRDRLPYQYASLIEKSLKAREDTKDYKISRSQIRLAFYGQVLNPDIVIPILREAQVLLDKMKEMEKLKEAL